MWPYWVMFLIPAVMALRESVRQQILVNPWRMPLFKIPSQWWFVLVFLGLLVGWRHEVGADWTNYSLLLERAQSESGSVVFWFDDPGYRFLEWLATQLHLGIYSVNLVGGFVFCLGLVVFCRHLPRPWLALAVSVPYLIIVVAMGYSRQGIALGLVMIGLVELGRGHTGRFFLWIVFATAFHKSAVILLPIAALAASRRRIVAGIWAFSVLLILYLTILGDSVSRLTMSYVEQAYESEGALIRLIMNVLPASLLLIFRRQFILTLPQGRLWFWMSIISLVLISFYYLFPSSTAVDRIGLYILPLQLLVFAYIPEVFGNYRRKNSFWVFVILIYYFAVEFVWLNYASHSQAWLPYRFYLLELF